MTWHLRDREFEKKLNEKAPSILNFTTALNVRMARISSEALKNTLSVFVEFQRVGTAGVIHEHNVIEFSINEIEEVIEYNPKGWNNYPDVTPPESVMMRVDCFNESGLLIHSCRGYWNGQCWMTWNGYKLDDTQTIRFRPWED